MVVVLKVSRSGFYKWKSKGKKQVNAKICLKLRAKINKIFKSSDRNYGRQRIKIELEKPKNNIFTTESKIKTIMKLDGLVATKTGRPPKVDKEPPEEKTKDGKFPNLLKEVNITRPNQVWVTDITEISIPKHPKRAWLCTYRDPYNGEIKGYAYGFNQKTQLVEKALKNALKQVNVLQQVGLIIHSDNGKQFLQADFQKQILEKGIRWSNSRTYTSTDNAFAESWYSSMKTELFTRQEWKNYNYLFYKLERYINWYNEERIITRLKDSPKEYIRACLKSFYKIW